MQRIETLDNPYERLACAIIMQAVLDFRRPRMKKEIETFFYGPLVGACGIDGDILMDKANKMDWRYKA